MSFEFPDLKKLLNDTTTSKIEKINLKVIDCLKKDVEQGWSKIELDTNETNMYIKYDELDSIKQCLNAGYKIKIRDIGLTASMLIVFDNHIVDTYEKRLFSNIEQAVKNNKNFSDELPYVYAELIDLQKIEDLIQQLTKVKYTIAFSNPKLSIICPNLSANSTFISKIGSR